jgi:hypothetical protein
LGAQGQLDWEADALKNLLLAASAAALSLAATAAGAATFENWGPVASDGSFSGSFGDTGIMTPTFSDVFDLTLPTGTSSFTINSTFTTDPANDINFTSVTFNGQDFTIGSTGQNEFRFLNDVNVTAGATQHLVVNGTSGGNGSYDGVISFTPVVTGVPEPASWALMIMGFGGLGAVLRTRRRGRPALV